MTAQIGDIYKYNNKECRLVARDSSNLFNPKAFGMEPHAMSTACWRGYFCEYAIIDDELFLEKLCLFNADGKYPLLNGIKAVKPKFKYAGYYEYRNINMPISYTGKMLVGNEFIREYYIHMGLQKPWAYQELLELVFEDGILLECNDYSYIAKKIRQLIDDEKRMWHIPFEEIKKIFDDKGLEYYDDSLLF